MVKPDYKTPRSQKFRLPITYRDLVVFFGTAAVCFAFSLSAENWKEDMDGEGGAHTFRYVDAHHSVTRAQCPYTCADRQIPKESCKEWHSITKAEGGDCYVQDLRIAKDDAMPKSTADEVKKTTGNYHGKTAK